MHRSSNQCRHQCCNELSENNSENRIRFPETDAELIHKQCYAHTFRVSNETRGARWLSGRVSDSRARGRGFETYRRRVVSLSKTLYSPKVLVNYPGSGGSVPI